jgi:nicotinamidase-related amidase
LVPLSGTRLDFDQNARSPTSIMTTALVLIDLQNDYFPGGTMELVGAEAAVAQATSLAQTFRQSGLPIVHVQHISTRAGATFFLPGTAGVEIHASVRPAEGEALVVKHFPNGFRETDLHDRLRSVDASRLVLAGMMTHMCVDTTVRVAADLGFQCFLAGDACATRDLQFSGERVQAREVQLAYLAALNGAFATVKPAQALCRESWGQ